MKNPKISILVPVHNGEKTIKECINSILKQAYKDYELIIVDNNSNDKTKEIIEDFKKNNKNIIYVFEKTTGRGKARNTGILKSKGKIIAMTDSDCIVPENWIEELTKPILREKENAVMGFEEDSIDNYWTKSIQISNLDFINHHRKNDYVTCLDTKNFAIKSDIMKKMMFDENLGNLEDYELALRMRGKVKVKFLENVKVKHFHKNSFSKWVKLQFNRAYWNSKIFKKHKNSFNFNNEIMMKDFYLKGNISLLPWIIRIFTTKSEKNRFFRICSGIAWKLGTLYGRVT